MRNDRKKHEIIREMCRGPVEFYEIMLLRSFVYSETGNGIFREFIILLVLIK